jgi:glycosyltransferase involved in cell wall biosynthesis
MAFEEVRLAIVVPEQNVVSESFIRSHVEGLFSGPAVIWGSPRPLFLGGGGGVLAGVWKAAAGVLRFTWRMSSERAQGAIGRRLPDPMYSRALARFLRRTGVEVVLAEYGPTAVTILDACSVSRTPLVVHFHGYDAYQDETLDRHRESYRRLFAVAERIIAVSKDMVGQLEALGAPRDRIVYNPYGVDIDVLQGGRPGAADPTLLALGRFVEKKAPQLTLRAFAEVRREEPKSRLVMLGDGPLRDACITLTRDLRIEDSVSFPGSIAHDEVVSWMRRSRCFVQHSLRPADGDSEGTPLAILEASSCGLPVVSTRHAGIVEAVRDGESGFLVDEGDVDGMAAHMLRLVRDPELAAAMGAAGRRHIEAHYRMDESLGRLRSVLVEAAHGGR